MFSKLDDFGGTLVPSRGSLARMQEQFLLGGNLLRGLMPQRPNTMWGVVEDVFSGPSALPFSAASTEFAHHRGEYRALSVPRSMASPETNVQLSEPDVIPSVSLSLSLSLSLHLSISGPVGIAPRRTRQRLPGNLTRSSELDSTACEQISLCISLEHLDFHARNKSYSLA